MAVDHKEDTEVALEAVPDTCHMNVQRGMMKRLGEDFGRVFKHDDR